MIDSQLIAAIEHKSEVLAGNRPGDPHERTLFVYLPASYDHDQQARFPVVWVLASFASWGQRLFNLEAWDENIVQRMDRLVREGRVRPMIMAFPDCFTRYGGSQYVNSSAVGRYEDYITQELVPLVDSQFRTLASRDHRGVMGSSSGGYGALMLAMRHPDLFGAAVCHSGDMLFEHCYWPDIPGAIRALDVMGGIDGFLASFGLQQKTDDWFRALNLIAMSACYSPNPDSPHGFDLLCDAHTGEIQEEVWQRWLEHDPLRAAPQYLDQLRSLRLLYFDCGRRDEHNLFLGARALHRLLEQHGVRHIYEEFDGGHRGNNWRYNTSLPLLSDALTPYPG